MKRFALLFTLVYLFSSCNENKDFYLSEDEVKAFDKQVNPEVKNIAYISDRDLYLYVDAEQGSRQLTKDTSILRFMPRLSPDGLRIAYIHQEGYPIVVSAEKGDTVATFPQYKGVSCYDWVSGPEAGNQVSLYLFVNDSVKFTGGTLTVPQLPVNSSSDILQIGYDRFGNFFYLVKESRPGGDVTRLYRWQKSTGLIKEMLFNETVIRPEMAQLTVSPNGEVFLALAQDLGSAPRNMFIVFEANSLTYSLKEKNVKFNTVHYNSQLKQALAYGTEPFATYVKFIQLNYLPYPRAKDHFLDTAKFGKLISDFDWN